MRLSMIEISFIFVAGMLAGTGVFRWGSARYGMKISPVFQVVFILAGSAVCVHIMESRGMAIESILYSLCSFVLMLIGIIDEETFEIPPELNFIIGLSGCVRLFSDLAHWKEYLAGMAAVSGLFLMIALLTRGKGIGGGDMKLMAAAGLLLGYRGILLALLAGCLAGVFIHTLRMKFSGKGRVMALGPYLSFGILAIIIWGDEILQWYDGL